MRSILPVTPTMRYERMALALVASVLPLLVCVQFASMATQAAAALVHESISFTSGLTLRFFSFTIASTAFGLFGIAFLLFATIKVQAFQAAPYNCFAIPIRSTGLVFLWLAIAMVVPWVFVSTIQ